MKEGKKGENTKLISLINPDTNVLIKYQVEPNTVLKIILLNTVGCVPGIQRYFNIRI